MQKSQKKGLKRVSFWQDRSFNPKRTTVQAVLGMGSGSQQAGVCSGCSGSTGNCTSCD